MKFVWSGLDVCGKRSVDHGIEFVHPEDTARDSQGNTLRTVGFVAEACQREIPVVRGGDEVVSKTGSTPRVSTGLEDDWRGDGTKADRAFSDVSLSVLGKLLSSLLDSLKGGFVTCSITSNHQGTRKEIKRYIFLAQFSLQAHQIRTHEETNESSVERDETNLL